MHFIDRPVLLIILLLNSSFAMAQSRTIPVADRAAMAEAIVEWRQIVLGDHIHWTWFRDAAFWEATRQNVGSACSTRLLPIFSARVLDDELNVDDGSADLEDFIKAAVSTAIQNLSAADMETIKLDEMPSGCAVRFADGSIGDFLSKVAGRKVRVRIGDEGEVETREYDALREAYVAGQWCTIQLPNLVLLTEP